MTVHRVFAMPDKLKKGKGKPGKKKNLADRIRDLRAERKSASQTKDRQKTS
jgi:hypothetical protein